MKNIKLLSALLVASAAIFVVDFATAQSNDVAYIKTAQYIAIDTAAKRQSTLLVVKATWPDIDTFSAIQSMHAWRTDKGPLCALTHDRNITALSDGELLKLVLRDRIIPTSAITDQTRNPTACSIPNLKAMVSTLGLSLANINSIQCYRNHPETGDPGCDWYELKVASPSVWRTDWEAGLVLQTVGIVNN